MKAVTYCHSQPSLLIDELTHYAVSCYNTIPHVVRHIRWHHGQGHYRTCLVVQFVPFIQGPRNCLGQNFALMEARIVLALLAKVSQHKKHLAPALASFPVSTVIAS